MELKYKRVVIKISGEALSGPSHFGIESSIVKKISKEICECVKLGAEIAIVIGGGNFFRGRNCADIERNRADHMGMLATAINSLAFADSIEKNLVPCRVQTAIEIKQIAESYIRLKAVRHLEKGRVVIFACGTGNPYFSTDTAAALKAAEIGADIILLAKNTDGVYDSDPNLDENAHKFISLSHIDVLKKGLGVMDSTAASLCKDNNIPIIVFQVSESGNIKKAMFGEKIGTIISNSSPEILKN
ncbi:MAG: UMP kinase [Clostridiales bacterium]|jgi:uridylate kinase|nr:UMP kinase [Clostridiales bacterium]